jgi:hypothetical protein
MDWCLSSPDEGGERPEAVARAVWTIHALTNWSWCCWCECGCGWVGVGLRRCCSDDDETGGVGVGSLETGGAAAAWALGDVGAAMELNRVSAESPWGENIADTLSCIACSDPPSSLNPCTTPVGRRNMLAWMLSLSLERERLVEGTHVDHFHDLEL